MFRLLLAVLAYLASSSSGRAAPQDRPPYKDEVVSNLQLLHPVLSSKPDETFSKIPAEAFTFDPEMTKRHNELKYKGKISALTGEHLVDINTLPQHNIEELPDMYLILVKKYDDNEDNDLRDNLGQYNKYKDGNDARDNLGDYIKYMNGNDVRDNLGDYIKYRDGNDVRYTAGHDVKYDDGQDVAAAVANAIVSSDDRTTDDGQSSEYYTPSVSIVHHKPHYYRSPLTHDQHQTRHNLNIPIFKKQSSHSIYLNKDFNPDLDDKNIRVIPKLFPSKFMMNDKAAKKPEPLIVYVNKDLPAESFNNVKAMYKPQETPLPMSVFVDNQYKSDENDNNDGDAKTLQEIINEMHDSRHPAPIKVFISKEETQMEQESDSEVKHMNHLMHQIRALNKLLHGNDAPEPYTMYVNDQVITSGEEPTPTTVQQQHLSTVDGDSEHQPTVDSEQAAMQAICEQLGAAYCAGNLQIGKRAVSRRRGPHRLGIGREFFNLPTLRSKPPRKVVTQSKENQWIVLHDNKDQKLKQYVYVDKGQPFVV